MGEILTAEKAFLTLALYNVVKLSMCNFFPLAIQMGSETLISIKRIQDFLLLEEVHETSSSNVIETTFIGNNGSLKLKQVTGKWSEQNEGNTIDGVTFEAKSGQLVAIVGPVGSGKGSILQAILGNSYNLITANLSSTIGVFHEIYLKYIFEEIIRLKVTT